MKKAALVIAAMPLVAFPVFSIPCQAGELDGTGPTTQVYLRIPVGPAASAQDRKPSFGLAFKGRNDYTAFTLDSRLFESTYRNYEAGVLAGIEAKWLIVGAVAAGGAVALGSRTKTESNQQQQQNQQKAQQQQQQQQTQQTCPKTPPTC